MLWRVLQNTLIITALQRYPKPLYLQEYSCDTWQMLQFYTDKRRRKVLKGKKIWCGLEDLLIILREKKPKHIWMGGKLCEHTQLQNVLVFLYTASQMQKTGAYVLQPYPHFLYGHFYPTEISVRSVQQKLQITRGKVIMQEKASPSSGSWETILPPIRKQLVRHVIQMSLQC